MKQIREQYQNKSDCPHGVSVSEQSDMFSLTDHVEVVSLLQRVSNTRERTITLDVEMEDYHRIKNRTEVTADATK